MYQRDPQDRSSNLREMAEEAIADLMALLVLAADARTVYGDFVRSNCHCIHLKGGIPAPS